MLISVDVSMKIGKLMKVFILKILLGYKLVKQTFTGENLIHMQFVLSCCYMKFTSRVLLAKLQRYLNYVHSGFKS